MKFGLSESVIDMLWNLLDRDEDIEKVIIYGSRAKGNFKEGSDIDLTVSGKGFNHQSLLKLLSDIDDLSLPYKFDVSIFDELTNTQLIEHITRVGQVFYLKRKNDI